jgi:hypothetical protein
MDRLFEDLLGLNLISTADARMVGILPDGKTAGADNPGFN